MLLMKRKVHIVFFMMFFAIFLNGCDMFSNFNSTTTTTTSTTETTTSDSLTTTESDVTNSSSTDMTTSTEVTTNTSGEMTTTTQQTTSTTTETQQTTTTGSSVTTTSGSTTNQQTTTAPTTTQQTTTTLEPTTTVSYTYQVTTTSTTTEQTTAEEEFLITFHSEEGSDVDSMYYTVSSSFVLPESQREYYFFRGWYLDSNYSGNPITEIIPGMMGDMVLYAKWEEDYSYFILNFLGDFLVIPEHCLYVEGEEVRIIQEHVDDFMEVIGEFYFDSSSIDLYAIFQNMFTSGLEPFESDIIYATFSKYLIDMSNDYELPYYSFNGEVIRYVDPVDMVEYIAVDEIVKLYNAYNILGYTNFERFLDDLFRADFNLGLDLESMFSSAISHYAFSQVLLSLRNYNVLLIPRYDMDMNPIIITYGEGDTLTEYLALSEIEIIIDVMRMLGVTQLDTFSGDVYLDGLTDEDINLILSSVVMHVSISQQIFDSYVLKDFEPDSIIETYPSNDGEIKVIVKEEILRFARACVINGTHGFYYADFNVYDMMNLSTSDQQEMLSSVIVRYSITPQLEDIAETISYPLSADNYDELSTDNCLNISTIIEILEAYSEFLQ